MRITLLRHGKPAVELTGILKARDLARVAKAYEISGIVDRPPIETVRILQDHRCVICSDLPRSLESAAALGFGQFDSSLALFREVAIPHFNAGWLAMPISAWLIILRLLWLAGFSRNGESFANARGRARQAAKRLIEFAAEHRNVLLIGHGVMNYLISKELRKNGWSGPAKPGGEFWEFGVYTYSERKSGK